MPITSVDLDNETLTRARELTGSKSNRAVIDLALRQLIASKQKAQMIDAIAQETWLASQMGAPTIEYPHRDL